MEVVVQTLRDERPARPLHALVGIRNDKNWRPMLDRLIPEVDRLMLTVAPSVAPEKRWLREEMASWAASQAGAGAGAGAGAPVGFEPDFPRAVEAVQAGAACVVVSRT